mgnify:CR=1 FL=1
MIDFVSKKSNPVILEFGVGRGSSTKKFIEFAEKNNAIADLARKISHEIKNPLTPMLLSTEFIESQLEDEELINSIKSIKRQIFLIQNLVNEFSTYARLPKANITKLNLSEI